MAASPTGSREAPPRAGTFTVRRESGGRRAVLLVTAKRTGHWILPLGRIEEGESAGAAAARETEEEAGIRVEVGPSLGRITLDRRGVPGTVEFFLAEEVGEVRWKEDGSRRRAWIPLAEAAHRLPAAFRPVAEAARDRLGEKH